MSLNKTAHLIILYSFSIALIGILSIYFASQIIIHINLVDSNIIFNAPIAVLLSIFLFAIWEFILLKIHKEFYLRNINLLVIAILFSVFIIALIIMLFQGINIGYNTALWKIMEYFFILIPIDFILILYKKYMLIRKRSDEQNTN